MAMSDAREQFEKEYAPPTWAIKANGKAGRAIHFSQFKREWEGFQKGFEAGRLSGLEEAAKSQTAEDLARRFHTLYEAFAPRFNYETRKESARPWSQVPEQNKNLMTAVCVEILNDWARAIRDLSKEGK